VRYFLKLIWPQIFKIFSSSPPTYPFPVFSSFLGWAILTEFLIFSMPFEELDVNIYFEV